MGALDTRRRKMTATEAAKRFGVSPRTIRYVVAEPRSEYESRAGRRQDEALQLRAKGLSHAEVGKALGISKAAAAGLVRRAKARPTQRHRTA